MNKKDIKFILEIILAAITIYVPTLMKNYIFQYYDDMLSIEPIEICRYCITTLAIIGYLKLLLTIIMKINKFNNCIGLVYKIKISFFTV